MGAGAVQFADWGQEGFKVWNKINKLEVAMLCWSIWKHRNELVWQAKIPVMNEVLHSQN